MLQYLIIRPWVYSDCVVWQTKILCCNEIHYNNSEQINKDAKINKEYSIVIKLTPNVRKHRWFPSLYTES